MASLAVEALLEGEAEALTRRAIEKALEGDTTALRLCLERLCPPRRERAVRLSLPPLESPEDAPAAVAAILEAVTAGEVSPSEGQAVTALIEGYRRAVETADHERRLAALEARTKGSR